MRTHRPELIVPDIPAALQSGYRPGDCFPAALSLALRWGRTYRHVEHLDVTLVHAVITGQGPIDGILHHHAWVEFQQAPWSEEMGLDFFAHLSTSPDEKHAALKVLFGVQRYRAIARIQAEARYTLGEAVREMLEKNHCGPWAAHLQDFPLTQPQQAAP